LPHISIKNNAIIMYITTSIVVAALASIAQAQAQTPKGFTPSVNTKLDLIFNSTTVKTPGELLSKASTSYFSLI
jgi:hypothetical protein